MTDLSVYSSKVNAHEPIHYEYANLRKMILLFTGEENTRQELVDAWQYIYSLDENALYNLDELCKYLLGRVGVSGVTERSILA